MVNALQMGNLNETIWILHLYAFIKQYCFSFSFDFMNIKHILSLTNAYTVAFKYSFKLFE